MLYLSEVYLCFAGKRFSFAGILLRFADKQAAFAGIQIFPQIPSIHNDKEKSDSG